MIIYHIFQIAFFLKNSKFGMKCIEKYDASAKAVSRKLFLDVLINHRNLLWNINFLKFHWLFLNFPDFS